MSDEEIVIAALLRMGDGTAGRADADEEVTAMALRMRSHLHERSLAMRTLRSAPISATVETVEYEEATTRLVVRYRPDYVREGYDAVESVRTDRTDGWHGDRVRRMWDGLEGRHVRIYKLSEETGNAQRPMVRVAPFVELLEP